MTRIAIRLGLFKSAAPPLARATQVKIPEREDVNAERAMTAEELGSILREARRDAGLTQQQLAAASGVGVRKAMATSLVI